MTIKSQTPLSLADQIRDLLDHGSRAVLVTVVDSDRLPVGSKLLVPESGERAGNLGDPNLNDAVLAHASDFLSARDPTRTAKVSEFAPALENLSRSLLLFERIEAEPSLVIAGAGHVGASLARLAALVGYRVTLIDDRPEFVSRQMFQAPAEDQINLVAAENWASAIGAAISTGHGVSIAIVTRGHKQDEDCLRAALAANPDYIGMIGSKRRTNIVLDKLHEEGFETAQLKRVRAPIGLDIGAVSPEEVALAILAEIVAERRGAKGSSLSSWRRERSPSCP
jgi:xanthine dehydrogenase accessory factor